MNYLTIKFANIKFANIKFLKDYRNDKPRHKCKYFTHIKYVKLLAKVVRQNFSQIRHRIKNLQNIVPIS